MDLSQVKANYEKGYMHRYGPNRPVEMHRLKNGKDLNAQC